LPWRVSGNVVQAMVAHFSEERLAVGRFLLAEAESAFDEAAEGAQGHGEASEEDCEGHGKCGDRKRRIGR